MKIILEVKQTEIKGMCEAKPMLLNDKGACFMDSLASKNIHNCWYLKFSLEVMLCFFGNSLLQNSKQKLKNNILISFAFHPLPSGHYFALFSNLSAYDCIFLQLVFIDLSERELCP